MKRKILSFLLVLFLCWNTGLAVSVSANTHDARFWVHDQADLLSSAEESELVEKFSDVGEKYNICFSLITVDSLNGEGIDPIIEQVYASKGMPFDKNQDGVVVLVSMDEREYYIVSSGFAGYAIDMDAIYNINDAIGSYMTAGLYADAFHRLVNKCDYYLNSYSSGYYFNSTQSLLIAIVIGLVAGLIVALVLKGQLTSVHKNQRANAYVAPGSMQITIHHDLFLYRKVDRTRREPPNSGHSSSPRSGGGPPRNIGRGSF